jgi:hypothetical protein
MLHIVLNINVPVGVTSICEEGGEYYYCCYRRMIILSWIIVLRQDEYRKAEHYVGVANQYGIIRNISNTRISMKSNPYESDMNSPLQIDYKQSPNFFPSINPYLSITASSCYITRHISAAELCFKIRTGDFAHAISLLKLRHIILDASAMVLRDTDGDTLG